MDESFTASVVRLLTGLVSIALSLQPASLSAQTVSRGPLKFNTGREIFQASCAACHGRDGAGAPKAVAGFEPPSTFPDFTDCESTTPETDISWKAVIRDGGPSRGFSQIMPSFGEALTPDEIDKVVEFLRTLCRDEAWPRGELNLPRALVTEKAFPENETVITTTINGRGAPAVSNSIVYERRFGARNQVEVSLPFSFQRPDRTWYGGINDIGLGYKRELFSSLRSGSILSVQGEAILPTGNGSRDLGSGVTVFESFASYGQLLPAKGFLQFQAGTELPTHTRDAPRAVFWRAVAGKSFNQGMGLQRLWSPMVEFLADREFQTGAKTDWDILPQFQVTLSKRQHIRANIGVRVPVNNTAGRPVQVMFYLLWDWFDGGLLKGW